MKPYVTPDGWLRVPYTGPEHAVTEIQVGTEWKPAFLDFEDGRRVAQARHRGPVPAVVMVRVNGEIAAVHRA